MQSSKWVWGKCPWVPSETPKQKLEMLLSEWEYRGRQCHEGGARQAQESILVEGVLRGVGGAGTGRAREGDAEDLSRGSSGQVCGWEGRHRGRALSPLWQEEAWEKESVHSSGRRTRKWGSAAGFGGGA